MRKKENFSHLGIFVNICMLKLYMVKSAEEAHPAKNLAKKKERSDGKMERWTKRTIELAMGLVFTGKQNPSVVPFYPQKTELSFEEDRYFKRTTPERVGISSGRLLAMLKALEKERRANVHSLLLVKDGAVILDCSAPGYKTNSWHLAHSMSKTVTGIAIGMLIDEGRLGLDTRICSIFPEYTYRDKRVANITVEHLLKMSSGIKFAEAGSVSESAWTEAFFSSSMYFSAGSDFNYNSMNTYVLGRILQKITGSTLCDYLESRLFSPLHIDRYFWEMGPEGVEKGGWGLYLSCESWAKIGQMLLDGGVFEDKRIISEKWVSRSTEKQIVTPDVIGKYDYGYQLWVGEDGQNVLFNGMLGQNVWINPRNRMVLVLSSGNNELFQNSPAMAIVEKYLGKDLSCDLSESCFAGDLSELESAAEHFFECRHWIRPYKYKRGVSYRLGMRSRTPFPEEWNDILGKYSFCKNNCAILPLFVRGMQNNLRGSIDGVWFEREGDTLSVTFLEGGVSYSFEVGFCDFKESVLEVHGERYRVKVMGEAMEDEDRNMLYKLEFLFPELPNTRRMKFSFDYDGALVLRLSEMPNERIADVFAREAMATSGRITFINDMINKRLGKGFVQKKLTETFAPTLVGAKAGSENYTQIMDAQREKVRANEKTAALINAIIDRFLRVEAEEEESDGASGLKSFFGDIVERIKARMPSSQNHQAQPLPPPEE